jgi:vacuolar-type H+-ATPase subunit I/STV1
MSKTASHVKDKYNAKTYDRYTLYLRKDDNLNNILQRRKESQPLSEIVKDALALYFQTEPDNTKKPSKATPSFTTKRQRRAAVKKIIKQLEQIRDAEETSRDNFHENFQNSPNYEAAEESISMLEDALESLESAY